MLYNILISVAPIVGVVLTVGMALLPSDSLISSSMNAVKPDSGRGYGVGWLIPDRNILAILLLMYIPAVYLWRFAGKGGDRRQGRDMRESGNTDFEIFPAIPEGNMDEMEVRKRFLSDPILHQDDELCQDVKTKRTPNTWQTRQIMLTVMGINLVKPYLEKMWRVEGWQWLWMGHAHQRNPSQDKMRQNRRSCHIDAGEERRPNAEEERTARALTSFWKQLMTWIWWDQASSSCFCDANTPSIQEKYQDVIKKYNRRLNLYKRLPLRTCSRLWGQINQLVLPSWLRPYAFRLYCWMFSCSIEEIAIQDLTHYKNLSEFFRRSLKPGLRPISSAQLTSPADGTVMYLGQLVDGALEQVKGVTYSLRGFLGPIKGVHPRYLTTTPMVMNKSISASALTNMLHKPAQQTTGSLSHTEQEADVDVSDELFANQLLINPENELYQCIVYLSPGDYHRFHSPTDWNVFSRRHFPGELFSVNPGVARWLQGLYNFNERAVYCGKWQHGFFSMAAVGATNVGSIHVLFDKSLKTNDAQERRRDIYYDRCFTGRTGNGLHKRKGDEFGYFDLGSTMVMIFEAPPNFKFSVKPGQRVKYGQPIGTHVKRPRGSIRI